MVDFRLLLSKQDKHGRRERIVPGLSVQASSYHYSSPREDNLEATEYTEFELMTFGREASEVCLAVIDYDKYNSSGVYAYVPAEHVQTIIERLVTEHNTVLPGAVIDGNISIEGNTFSPGTVINAQDAVIKGDFTFSGNKVIDDEGE